jgi:hypothetical protein
MIGLLVIFVFLLKSSEKLQDEATTKKETVRPERASEQEMERDRRS